MAFHRAVARGRFQLAQEGISGDAAATYQWVHTNASPGQRGCFGLNGGGISGSWNAHGPWSVVADFSSGVANGAPAAGSSLTLTSFLAGARYELPRLRRTWIHGAHRVQPFAQILAGVAHAGCGAAGIADGTNRFAARAGGGFDVPVSRRFSVRGEVDYFATTFANGTNDHQKQSVNWGGGCLSLVVREVVERTDQASDALTISELRPGQARAQHAASLQNLLCILNCGMPGRGRDATGPFIPS